MNDLLSILIVNYKSAHILEDCLRSIGEQNIDVEVVVVDNDSGDADRDALEAMLSRFPFLRVILNNENRGFSRANNQALAQSSGKYVLFLNPDTFLFPSCLTSLLFFLRATPGAGGLIPRLWMDKNKSFLLPPSYQPSLSEKIRDLLCRRSDYLLRRFRSAWVKKALKFWDSEVPLPVEAISGAFLLTKRSVLDAVGSFDERFPLYFEDSDLCRRIRKAGLRLWHYPDAEAVHYYNQSAKGSSESMGKFVFSERLYMEKYYGPLILRGLSLLSGLAGARTGFSRKPSDFSAPIETPAGGYLLFSPLETMMPCAAHRVAHERFTFGREFVEKLSAGVYYALLVSRHGKIYKTFIFEKR